jgi:DNA-binding response OmpR family regulator
MMAGKKEVEPLPPEVEAMVDEVPVFRLTPTQRRILELLSDGAPHSRVEIHKCLWDDMGALSNIQVHISALRKIVRLDGEDILCVIFNRTVHYRHVKLLHVPRAKARIEAVRRLMSAERSA